jgi:U4/U6 small nuclear ribonucleoprotein PRP3
MKRAASPSEGGRATGAGDANKRLAPIHNPYLDSSAESAPKSSRSRNRTLNFEEGALTKKAQADRKRLEFVERLAQNKKEEVLRAAEASQALSAAAAKASSSAPATAANIVPAIPAPPMEWWDVAYLPKPLRAVALAAPHPTQAPFHELSISHNKQTLFVEHPVPLLATDASTDSQQPLPVYQTKKELKRLRRNQRATRTQEKRDMIAVGLLPPPPNKVRLSNLMRVLTTEATLDPSMVVAKVKAETKQREAQHMARNSLKKLTPEEREEKTRKSLERDAANGICLALFRMDHVLGEGGEGEEEEALATKRRSKILATAQDLNLTGRLIAVMGGGGGGLGAVVLAEGGPRSVRKFCRLMLRRLRWGGQRGRGEADEGMAEDGEAGHDTSTQGEAGHCHLVWRGQAPRREFDKFRLEICRNGAEAKNILQSRGAAYLWDAVERFDPSLSNGADVADF